MLAVQGYYNGLTIRPLEKILAKPNQRVIITVMDNLFNQLLLWRKKGYEVSFLSMQILRYKKKKREHGNVLRQKNIVMLDANMILRYLLNDNADMAEKAEEYINAGDVSTTIEVIAEEIYVLKGVYSLDRDKIVDTMKDFMWEKAK